MNGSIRKEFQGLLAQQMGRECAYDPNRHDFIIFNRRCTDHILRRMVFKEVSRMIVVYGGDYENQRERMKEVLKPIQDLSGVGLGIADTQPKNPDAVWCRVYFVARWLENNPRKMAEITAEVYKLLVKADPYWQH